MYFPKSQIQTNLYTNGNEYQRITDKTIYTGFYFKTSTGQLYTGKTPNDGPNIQLVKITNVTDPTSPQPIPNIGVSSVSQPQKIITSVFSNISPDLDITAINNEYVSINGFSQRNNLVPQNRSIPLSFTPILTDENVKVGILQRYFCKKNNELIYIETNKLNYELLTNKSPNIAWDLYSPMSMLWYISGGLDEVYKTNKNLASIIERKNKWHGFTQYFRDDFTQFYLDS